MGILGDYTVVRPANHDEWLKERGKGIGSSEVGTIFGVNNFDTPIQLWRRKKGLAPPVEETDVMALGHAVEQGVAYMFARATGAIIDESSTIDWLAVNNERPYLRVSPDRLFWPAGTPEEERTLQNALMLECKTTSHDIDPNCLPNYWYCQIQYQMSVLGLKKCAIGWISAHGGRWSFDYTWVDFNESFFRLLLKKLVRFWEYNILQNVCPDDVLTVDDASLLYSQASPKKVIGYETSSLEGQNVLRLVEKYSKNKELANRANEESDAAKKELMMLMQDNEILELDNMKVATWKNTKGRKSLDTERLYAEHPDIYNEYLSQGRSYRTFKITG